MIPLQVRGEARALLVFERAARRAAWRAEERAALEAYAVLLGGMLGVAELELLSPSS